MNNIESEQQIIYSEIFASADKGNFSAAWNGIQKLKEPLGHMEVSIFASVKNPDFIHQAIDTARLPDLSPQSRKSILSILGEIGDEDMEITDLILPILEKSLDSDDTELSLVAADALKRKGKYLGLATISGEENDDGLRRIGIISEMLLRKVEAGSQESMQIIAGVPSILLTEAMKEKWKGPLLRLYDDSPQEKSIEVMEELSQVCEEGDPALASRLSALTKSLDIINMPGDDKMKIIRFISHFGSVDCLPILKTLGADEDRFVRSDAKRALAKFASKR